MLRSGSDAIEPKNKAEALPERAARDDETTGKKQCLFGSVTYGTHVGPGAAGDANPDFS